MKATGSAAVCRPPAAPDQSARSPAVARRPALSPGTARARRETGRVVARRRPDPHGRCAGQAWLVLPSGWRAAPPVRRSGLASAQLVLRSGLARAPVRLRAAAPVLRSGLAGRAAGEAAARRLRRARREETGADPRRGFGAGAVADAGGYTPTGVKGTTVRLSVTGRAPAAVCAATSTARRTRSSVTVPRNSTLPAITSTSTMARPLQV